MWRRDGRQLHLYARAGRRYAQASLLAPQEFLRDSGTLARLAYAFGPYVYSFERYAQQFEPYANAMAGDGHAFALYSHAFVLRGRKMRRYRYDPGGTTFSSSARAESSGDTAMRCFGSAIDPRWDVCQLSGTRIQLGATQMSPSGTRSHLTGTAHHPSGGR